MTRYIPGLRQQHCSSADTLVAVICINLVCLFVGLWGTHQGCCAFTSPKYWTRCQIQAMSRGKGKLKPSVLVTLWRILFLKYMSRTISFTGVTSGDFHNIWQFSIVQSRAFMLIHNFAFQCVEFERKMLNFESHTLLQICSSRDKTKTVIHQSISLEAFFVCHTQPPYLCQYSQGKKTKNLKLTSTIGHALHDSMTVPMHYEGQIKNKLHLTKYYMDIKDLDIFFIFFILKTAGIGCSMPAIFVSRSSNEWMDGSCSQQRGVAWRNCRLHSSSRLFGAFIALTNCRWWWRHNVVLKCLIAN